MNWYLLVLKKYAVFSGRARRQEYWYFILINMVIGFILQVINQQFINPADAGGGVLGMIYSLAVLVPTLAVGVRRLHDTGRAGWWLLLGLIPVIGILVLIFFFIQDSEAGNNEYGANPKQEDSAHMSV
ncbi:DUF805 domain-containing protein [Photobacterium sanctipauli]|uniref:DUF805 domain-containing protein n=1 Tax=Photobacterium sanctipauli TaxID=1342794 RepID=A0A2T3NPQ7_9GAMM|nr:DUF805 domain-containing protein [Photobacterium sanctipauli]PSW18266.1 DUF805 domain-containing protein [Photobacterium sanctipauli]